MTLKLRAGVLLVDTDYGIAVLDEDSGQYFDLNPSGALVLRTLLDGGTCEQAAQELSTEYVVDLASANQDVTALLEEFRSTGLGRVPWIMERGRGARCGSRPRRPCRRRRTRVCRSGWPRRGIV
jgi:hypothetical protein